MCHPLRPAAISLLAIAAFLGCSPNPPTVTPNPPAQPEPMPAVAPMEKVEQPIVAAKPPVSDEKAALAPPPLVVPAGPVENGEFGKVGPPIPISFDDVVLGIKANLVFYRSMLSPRAKELEGKMVTIRGYIYGDGAFTNDGIKDFALLRNTECVFGPGGPADHVIHVVMSGDASAKYTTGPVTVTGLLTVKPYTGFDGNTWAIYHIQARSADANR